MPVIGLFFNRYISANIPETDQINCLFLRTMGGMYPVGSCPYHILPDVLWHRFAGSWSGLWYSVRGVRSFFIFTAPLSPENLRAKGGQVRTWVEPRDIKLLLWEKLNTSRGFAEDIAAMAELPQGELQSFHAELVMVSAHPAEERDLFFFCTIDGKEYVTLLELGVRQTVERPIFCRNKVRTLMRNYGKVFKGYFYALIAADATLACSDIAGEYPRKISFSTLLRSLEKLTPEQKNFYSGVFDNVVIRDNYIPSGFMLLK